MSKLFENGFKIANDEGLFYSDDDEAGNLLQTWNSRKRSMLPKGNPANTSKITMLIWWHEDNGKLFGNFQQTSLNFLVISKICMNTSSCVLFRM